MIFIDFLKLFSGPEVILIHTVFTLKMHLKSVDIITFAIHLEIYLNREQRVFKIIDGRFCDLNAGVEFVFNYTTCH